ncbi:MAG TPA: hypothetical protein VHR45_17165 [Thermoanaerobaculia bacterium]|nr:hypothetical protein [Thermoanaerobaculia bacterium]
MILRSSPGLLLCLLAALGCATGASPRVAAPRQFDFHSNIWLNLHLFVRVVARGEGCRERVVEAWDPHLAGKTTLEETLDALVAAWPAQ